MDVSRDLLAAIGEVVVEATKLELGLAQLVTLRWGWNGQHERAMTARPGCVREHLTKLVDADPSWSAIRRLQRDALAVLDERNVLVHSVVVHVTDEDDEVREIQLWHARSHTSAELPAVTAVEELAFDIGRCFRATVMTMPEAEERLKNLGATGAPLPPRTLS